MKLYSWNVNGFRAILQKPEWQAWFAANPYDWNGTRPKINLVTDEMRPTPLGEVFARVLRALGSSRLAAE